MEYLFHDNIGLVHLVSSILSVIFGSLVLALKKGTDSHVKIGYAYFISMVVLNGTAFMIYRLFSGFGIFHVAALASSLTLIGGMVPIWRRKSVNAWKYQHFSFMYWSVIGLYAAFASELLTRIPTTPFFGMVGIATAAVMILGIIFFRLKKEQWKLVFGLK